jgi:hypothetical protein
MALDFRPAALGALLLSGCGPFVDDPANPPLRGRWQRESKVTALVVNDIWVDRKKAPFRVPEDETEVRNCAEPAIRSNADINRELVNKAELQCHFGELERDGGSLSATGTCDPKSISGGTVSGTMEFAGHLGNESADGRISATLFFRRASGDTERVRFGVETKWKRLGDCRI